MTVTFEAKFNMYRYYRANCFQRQYPLEELVVLGA